MLTVLLCALFFWMIWKMLVLGIRAAWGLTRLLCIILLLGLALFGILTTFWTSSCFADLSVFPSLICGSCSSGQGFAYSFLQIPPHDGHPCCSAMYFVVAYAYSGLSPVRARPWRANKKRDISQVFIGKYLSADCVLPQSVF